MNSPLNGSSGPGAEIPTATGSTVGSPAASCGQRVAQLRRDCRQHFFRGARGRRAQSAVDRTVRLDQCRPQVRAAQVHCKHGLFAHSIHSGTDFLSGAGCGGITRKVRRQSDSTDDWPSVAQMCWWTRSAWAGARHPPSVSRHSNCQKPPSCGGQEPAWVPGKEKGPRLSPRPLPSLVGVASASADPEDAVPALRASALHSGLPVLHRDLLRVLDLDLHLVPDAIGFSHLSSLPSRSVAGRGGVPQLRFASLSSGCHS